AVHVQSEVGLPADARLAGVDTHADAQLDTRRPVVLGEGLLCSDDGLRSLPRILEDDEELVAALVDDDAALTFDGLVEEPAVFVEDVRVPVAETLHELRRALDVGEDECDRSMRK